MLNNVSLVAQVISLPLRADRRSQFIEQAVEQHIPFVFVDGVTAAKPYEGISQAHRSVVAMAKAREMDRVLVMEDDALFTAPGAYRYFLEHMPVDFDLYLGGIYGGNPDENGSLNWFYGMHCYVVAARFYDTFLSVDPHTHIDHALHGKGQYYVCQPYACIQRNGYSDQEGKYVPNQGRVHAGKLYRGPQMSTDELG